MKLRYLILIACFIISCKKDKSTPKERAEVIPFQEIDSIIESIQPKIEKAFLLGKFDYRMHEDFTKVHSEHSSKTLYLQIDTYIAFKKMYKAAKQDGIHLIIVSGTRNFAEQKGIWNRKWKKYNNLKPIERIQKIMEYSSMPSTSRHHWGTDMDLNNLTNSYFTKGEGKKIYDWLVVNAHDYGFYQVYTDKSSGRTGYNLERWHWSYMPLASGYLEAYNNTVSYSEINDFDGSDLAKALEIIKNYVNGISEKTLSFQN